MDFSLKPCTTTKRLKNHNDSLLIVEDRLSSLPDELLIRILLLLPTKDAAATCVLSRRLTRVFPWITTLDFDASYISHCSERPYGIQQFPSFVNFVNTVLHAHQSPNLTKFRLQVGPDFVTRNVWYCIGSASDCFPDLKYTQINAWISFPLTCYGLRELDLRIQMSQPGDCAPEIFTCETLEVLKLDVNLGFDQVSIFCLPNLRVLYLCALLIYEDEFLTRLVSSCPVLEDLTVAAHFTSNSSQASPHVYSVSISSLSLRRLSLTALKIDDFENTDLVRIHTPNVNYFYYHDNLAYKYSIQKMHSLVEAQIGIPNILEEATLEASRQQMLDLIRPLSNVQHISLLYMCTWGLDFVEVKDQLPLFPYLKCLELGHLGATYWDKVLLAFLSRSPILETLVFPKGLMDDDFGYPLTKALELERKFFRTPQAIIPHCCKSHLKRIVIKFVFGKEREVDLIQFLLRHALVLEELVIFKCQGA